MKTITRNQNEISKSKQHQNSMGLYIHLLVSTTSYENAMELQTFTCKIHVLSPLLDLELDLD